MTAAEPPWHEAAIAVQRGEFADDGSIVAEGRLRDVAWAVSRQPAAIRRRIRLSLPDRHVPPFSYAGAELDALLALVPLDER